MNDPVKELIKGNIDCFNKLELINDKVYSLELLDKRKCKKEVLNNLFYDLVGDNTDINKQLFNMVYLDPELKKFTYYLLHNNYIVPELLTIEQVDNILKYTTWGKDYVLNNLNRLIIKNQGLGMYRVIFNFFKLKEETLNELIGVVLNQDEYIKYDFAFLCKVNKIELDEDILCSILYKSPDNYKYQQLSLPFVKEENLLSPMPLSDVLELGNYNQNNKKFRELVKENVLYFFNADKKEKLELLNKHGNIFSKEILEKYRNLLELYKIGHLDYGLNRMLSSIIDKELESTIDQVLKYKPVFIGKGSTTTVFKYGDKVLKLSEGKHEINCERNLFLIAPTKTQILYNDNNEPILIIEEQDYLSESYNGIRISSSDITLFIDELDNMGYVTTDPNNLRYRTDNFGFLKSYKDANLGEYNSPEELPEWFKKRPLVLYDVDLIYKKEAEYKKTF